MRTIHHISAQAGLAITAMLAASALAGCGTGANQASSGAGTGRVTVTVNWPTPGHSRLIPAATQSLRLDLESGATITASQILNAPTTGEPTQVTTTFSGVPVGAYSLISNAYPQAGAVGTALATGSSPVTVSVGQASSVTITMGSTISALGISPANPTMALGQAPLTLNPVATDGAGNTVLVTPAKLTWVSNNTAVATVSSLGQVAAVADGITTITLTDTESGKSGTTVVNVSGQVAVVAVH
jgi:hypothetical protein